MVTISHKPGTTDCTAIGSSVASATLTVLSVSGTNLVTNESPEADENSASDCLIARPALSSTAEEDRYSEVSVDNFKYYELQCSNNAHSATVELTLHTGTVQLYHSDLKLPTRDTTIGHGAKYPSATVPWTDGGTKLTVPISFDQINKRQAKIYIGIFGVAETSAYDIKATQTLLPGALPTGPVALDYSTVYSQPISVSLVADEYHFMAVPVGPLDTEMYVASRSGSGSRTATLSTSASEQAAWGIDWYEPLTATWKRNHEDEHDLDVTLSLDMTTASTLTAYGSSRETFASAERGYDQTAVLAGSSGSLTLSHYSFADQVVYLSLLSTTYQTVTFTLGKTDISRTLSVDTTVAPGTCAALSQCSSRGSCVREKCYCDDGYTGSDCSVPAFLGTDATPENPRVVISSDWPGVNSPFADSATIQIPYEIRSAPPYSKVRIRLDGKPWPDRLGSVIHLGSEGTPASGNTYFSVNVMDLNANGVDHTIQVYLTAAGGKLLDAAERRFQTKKSGGCAPDSNGNACTGHGLCFNGYCVCYDGWIGTDCSITDSTQGSDTTSGEVGVASYTSPGQDFVATAAYKEFKTTQTANKITKATTRNTMGLAAMTAELSQMTTELSSKDIATQTKIESTLDTIAATVTSKKVLRDVQIDDLHRRLDANAAAIQQDALSSERGKAARLEEHINTMRSLHAHQTQVQNRLDAVKSTAQAVLASKTANVAKHLAENAFTINQVKLMNGPPLKVADLKKSECEVDQFYGVTCAESLDNAGIAGFVQNAPGTMDASSTLRG